MASYMKRLQAYAAPILLVYTVMVTWVLLSTAWSDDTSGMLEGEGRDRRDGSGAGFLDVLVQEERRHMKSFRDVVRNYRNAVNTDDGDKLNARNAGMHKSHSAKGKNDRRHKALVKVSSENQGEGKPKAKSKHAIDPGGLEDTAEGPAKNSVIHRPGSMVEVEEWDRESYTKPKKKSHPKELKVDPSVTMSLTKVRLDSDSKPKNSVLSPNQSARVQEADYFLEFCDRTFDDPRIIPNICNRPVIELTNKKHIPINPATLSFKRLGDVKVYSSFLDVRGKPHVRTIALAPAGQKNGPSVYWCLFHIDSEERTLHEQESNGEQNGRVDKVLDGSRGLPREGLAGKGENLTQSRETSVMSFYAASDGHGRANQFYILSCPVPHKALSLFSVPDKGVIAIQMVVGNREKAFIEDLPETIFVDVIINKHVHLTLASPAVVTSQDVKKTLLVDIEPPVRARGVNGFTSGLTFNGSEKFISKNTSNPDMLKNTIHHREKRQAINTFEVEKDDDDDDDDDEDKEISREKKGRRSEISERGSKSGNVINIPYSYRQVGDSIVSCVAPLHGPISAMQLVEFMELSLLLGVQHVIFYVPSSPSLGEARAALRMYETRGLVTSLPWDLPDSPDKQHNVDQVWARGRDVALNDCLYRTIHLFDWAIFLDLDEFFVPRVTSDLPSFLKYLRARHRFNASRTTDLVFPSAYFPPPTRAYYKNLTSVAGFLPDVNKFTSLKSVHRTYFDQRQTLRMLRPDTAARVGAGERKRTSFFLSPRYASVHHYSYCPRNEIIVNTASKNSTSNGKVAVPLCNHLKVDWTMWRYKTLLIERSRSSARRLGRG